MRAMVRPAGGVQAQRGVVMGRKTRWAVVAWGAGMLLLLGTAAARAEEYSVTNDNSSAGITITYPSATAVPQYPTYLPPPGPVPSGNIIGYHPITESALEAAMSGAVPAQPAARPAYPTPGQAGFAPSYGYGSTGGAVQVQVAAPPAGQPNSGLPVGYLTGVVGEGFYTLGRDDVIQIVVRNQPEFSGTFVIGFDGKIQYNYLGDLPIAGLTKYEVQQVLEKMLTEYIRVPVVTVQILAYNSKVVYVIGAVSSPGKFIMRGDAIKLREAILAAGLPTEDAALSRVHVITPDLDDPKVQVINVKQILYKGRLKNDIDLTTGEIVVIPSTVMSKVNDFLGSLLSPITRAARFAAMAAL